MSGVKGKSGRKRSLGKIKRELEIKLDEMIVDAYDVLAERIRVQRDVNAAIYAINRRQGSPHQSIDHRVKGHVTLSAIDYRAAIAEAELEERKLLNEGSQEGSQDAPK